jgi:hypothetical protein
VAESVSTRRPVETPSAVPLFRCADCGFVTTASRENAQRAHRAGSSSCEGQIALVADFRGVPVIVPPARRRRSASRRAGDGGAVGPDARRGK